MNTNQDSNTQSNEAVPDALTKDEIQELDYEISEKLRVDAEDVAEAMDYAHTRWEFAQEWRELMLQRDTTQSLEKYLDKKMSEYYGLDRDPDC